MSLRTEATAPRSLDAWLAFIERQHVKPIDLSLDRVREVHARLAIGIDCPVITVAGTNGKGSTSAMLESILRAGGWRTGLYTSPHLVRYNERVRVGGVEAGDDALAEAFAAVEGARAGTPLTYFEFGTLAALWLFAGAGVEALVLEVGLGGRLDAVNIVDPDVAVLTSVGLDHMDYLGPTREEIGREKAGIFRAGRPAICADADPPATVLERAQKLGADLWLIDRDFGYAADAGQWRFWSRTGRRGPLPHPALRGAYQLANAAAALAALEAVRERLPVPVGAVRDGLLAVEWPGRFQVLPGRPRVILDVAHNPDAARALAQSLAAMEHHGSTQAVVGILGDKDATAVAAALRDQVDRWRAVTLAGARGRSAESMRHALIAAGVDAGTISLHDDPLRALAFACESAGEADRIIVFGSFLTVSAVLAARRPGRP